MNKNEIFKNYTLSNEEIENILKQIDKYINKASYINGEFDEDLKQIITIKIFKSLSKNRNL